MNNPSATTDRVGWSGDLLNIDTYLARIGLAAELPPTFDTLRAMQRAHVTSIPWENLDVVLGRPILLDIASLEAKLVRGRRGGYCYEHTELFAAALERMGFGVRGLTARVVMGTDRLRPEGHALLRVETAETALDGRVWLCDVGFGGSPQAPIELGDGAEVTEGGWRFRLTRRTTPAGTKAWVLSQHHAGGWLDLHVFTLEPRYPVDYAVANHYTSTHPHSPFLGRVLVQQMAPGVHHSLVGTVLTTTHPGGESQTRGLDASEIGDTLAETFGIVLDSADLAALEVRLATADAADVGGNGSGDSPNEPDAS